MFYLTVFILELLVDWVSYIRPVADLNVTNWNPQVALHLYFLLISKRSVVPIALAGVAANLLVRSANVLDLIHLEPIAVALLYLSASLVFEKIFDAIKIFEKSSEFLRFLGFCAVVSSVHAIIGTAIYFFVGELNSVQLIHSAIAVFIGDSTGLIILFPFLMVIHIHGEGKTIKEIFWKKEIQATLIAFGIFFFFLTTLDIVNPLRFTYLVAIPIFFIAFRFEIKDVMALILVVQIMLAVAFTYRGSTFERVMEIQFMLFVISSSIIYLSLIIFERREFQEKARLKRTERQLATMSGIILHEIAQPVTALGNFSMIQLNALDTEGEIDKEKLKSYAKSINTEINRVREILIQIKKSVSEEEKYLTSSVEIIAVIRSVLELIVPSAKALGVSVRLSTESELMYASISRQNLSIAVRNLLTNAVQAASNSGDKCCLVDIHQSADFCFIDFTDSGNFISRNHVEKIFDYGFKESEYGLGIGLSIAKDLLEISGSKILAYHEQSMKFRIVIKKSHETRLGKTDHH